MKNLVRAGVVLVAALALSGCSAISSGYITDKVYTEAWVEHVPMCSYGMPYPGMKDYPTKNSPYPCIIAYYQDRENPPTFRFDLSDNEDTGWVYVTEETFNAYEVGDYYDNER